MKYSSVKNPKWANSKHTIIDCEVNFDDLPYEYVNFSAVPSGDLPHTHEIYSRCLSGEFGQISEYVAPPNIEGAEAIEMLRQERNYLLVKNVDPVVSNPLRWGDLSDAKKQQWAEYRTALLNLTDIAIPVYVWDEEYITYRLTNVLLPVKPE